MTVGFFMGIRNSFAEEFHKSADEYIAAANKALIAANLPEYVDPESPPDIYVNHLFGRSALDHECASSLVQLSEMMPKDREPHIHLLTSNPYRVAFLPIDFTEPLKTEYSQLIWKDLVPLWIGSSQRLLKDLLTIALDLEIPLKNGLLSDDIALRINTFEPLFEEDQCVLGNEIRLTWLLMYEGARLSIQHNVALSLSG
jgi:hypothetical protein